MALINTHARRGNHALGRPPSKGKESLTGRAVLCLSLLLAVVAGVGAAPRAGATIPSSSCIGTGITLNACANVPASASIGAGSCVGNATITSGLGAGYAACAGDTSLTSVGAGSCVGDGISYGACAKEALLTSVGPGSCNGGEVCFAFSLTSVGAGSCNGSGGNCGALDTSVGNNSCNGPNASHFTSGAVGDCQDNSVTVPACAPPTAAPTQSPAANSAGWNNTNVTVTWNWTAGSTASPIDTTNCPSTSTSFGQGAITLTATCYDTAGTSTTATYTVNVDTTAPTTTLTFSPAAPSGSKGWYKGASPTFTLNATDTGGSGVATTYYQIDGGATQTYTGAAVTIPDGSSQTVGYWSVDNAGNTETTNTTSPIKVDTVAPTIAAPSGVTVNATSPSGAIVTYKVTFSDNTGGSGLASSGCSPASGKTFAIGSTTVTCNATDNAGNSATAVTFHVLVNGAADQLAHLHTQVVGVGPGTSLADEVTSIQGALRANNTADACGTLNAFIHEVNSQSTSIGPTLARQLVAQAKQIAAVIGC